MLERERELEVLEGVIRGVEGGLGCLVLIEGTAGIGKTRLLAETVELSRGRKLRVRQGRGGELERDMPFGVARQLLEPVLARCSDEERARLLSGSASLALGALGRTDPERPNPSSDPLAPIHGLYWLVANLAELEPVLLIIDDAQWADAQTIRFLDYLVRRLADLPVLVVVSVRSGEPAEPAELDRLRLNANVVTPRPLSKGAVRSLIAAQLETKPDAEFSEACWRATAGNPFLVAELVRGLRDDAGEPGGDGAVAIAGLGPPNIARYMLVRLGRFGQDAISLAQAIAVLGGSPQLRHAAKLAGLPEEQARKLCDQLRQAEILASGLPIDFVHPLVRQAIYSEISEGERSLLHRRAAEALSTTGATAGEIAPHLMACVPNGDQWVVAKLGEAAWEALRAAAYDGAQAYLKRALVEPPEEELPILYALGRCMLQTDPARASETLSDVAERTSDDVIRRRSLRDAAAGYVVAGDWSASARSHARLIDILPEREREQRLVAEAELFFVTMGGIGRDEATSQRIRSVASGLTGVTAGECVARQALAFDRFMAGAPVEEVEELATSFPPAVWEVRTVVALSMSRLLARTGRWEDATRVISRAAELARELGLVMNQSYYASIRSEVDRLAGRLADAEVEARTGLEIADGAAATFLNPGREAMLNLLAALLARGHVDEAERLASGLDLSAGMTEVPLTPFPLEVRGYLRLALGLLEAGVDDLLQLGEGGERMRWFNPALCPWRQEVAPPLAALGRATEAEELITVAEQRALAFGAAHVIGTVLRARALIEPRKRQIETLKDSVSALEAYGPPHELARSLLELGAALRRDARRSDARIPLRRALDLAHRCGAGELERRAHEELAAAGARPRRPLLSGPAALTATERRIAAMAARGMSNPQIAQSLFVTAKTVENHLGRIYAKLGINSRTRLVEALAAPDSTMEAPAAK